MTTFADQFIPGAMVALNAKKNGLVIFEITLPDLDGIPNQPSIRLTLKQAQWMAEQLTKLGFVTRSETTVETDSGLKIPLPIFNNQQAIPTDAVSKTTLPDPKPIGPQ